MMLWLWRRWRLALIWLSYRVPAPLERWLVERVLYPDAVGLFSSAELWRAKIRMPQE